VWALAQSRGDGTAHS